MGGSTDQAKGRMKQAIGALTGDENLKKDGRRDERGGRIKEKADEAIEVVRDKLGDAAETLSPKRKGEVR